ncbi:MAG TPA: hypothetical protein VK934_10325 [Fimbriimonas sp.]|nr:hypothetical protein [Fimbriimonas sp.]
MTELVFDVREAPEGGFLAQAVGHDIFSEADTVESLREQVRDAVHCHFDEEHLPSFIRLLFHREEVLAA